MLAHVSLLETLVGDAKGFLKSGDGRVRVRLKEIVFELFNRLIYDTNVIIKQVWPIAFDFVAKFFTQLLCINEMQRVHF